MMVVDSSAILAILLDENDAQEFRDAIEAADNLVISAVNVHETTMILLARNGSAGVERFWRLLKTNRISVRAFDETQARAATTAFGRYGKGFHSRARLNLADCAAYALAKSLSSPLLFKGDDFTHTDVGQWR